MARLLSGRMLTGAVEWSSRPVGVSLHEELPRDLEALAASGYAWAHAALDHKEGARHLYVSAGGFEEGFRARAADDGRVMLIDLEALYGGGR